MKTLEKVLAIALFITGALSLIVDFGFTAFDDYRVVMAFLVFIGVLSLLYGRVRAINLQHGASTSKDRNSPPGHFIAFGWSMLALSIILVGVKVLWLH